MMNKTHLFPVPPLEPSGLDPDQVGGPRNMVEAFFMPTMGLFATWEAVHAGKTKTELARRLDIPLNNLSKIRRGDLTVPRRAMSMMIEDVLVHMLGPEYGKILANALKID